MSVRLLIPVPNIDTVIQQFDRIRVFRSIYGSAGPYEEITAVSPEAATLTGTKTGPFVVVGMESRWVVDRGAEQTVAMTGSDPLSATQIARLLVAADIGLTAQDDGAGRLQISTVGAGTDNTLACTGDVDFADVVGLTIGRIVTGTTSRISLVENVSTYLFEDVSGTEDNWYRTQFFNSQTLANSILSDPIKSTLAPAPKQQADSRAPRGLTLVRGNPHVFRETFFADPECTIPLVPIDASRYPSFQIVDINGQIVASGLATLDGTAGNYRVEFFTPPDALITDDDRRWRIDWLLIDEDDRQYEKTTEFDVRDVEITATPVRDQKLMAMCGAPFRVFIRELKRPYSLRLDLHNANSQECLVEGAVFPGTDDETELRITEVVDNETYVYYYDVPPDTLAAKTVYRATWTIMTSLASSPEYAFQIIEVPPPYILQFFPALRMVIDKYQKKREIIQAYQDSDIYEYLVRGLQIINGWHPVTNYQFESLPGQLVPFWLMAGQVWGLNAQHLLETDLQFSFGGQTVTLDYDHTGNIEAGISRAMDFLTNNLTNTKTPLLRRSISVGVMAGKPFRYTALHNFTFRIAKYGSQDFLTLLSNIGLLALPLVFWLGGFSETVQGLL